MTRFQELQTRIARIGLEHHAQTILENSRRNAQQIYRTIHEVARSDKSCLVVSAGPSLYRQKILARLNAQGVQGMQIIATDGAYIQCLKAGIIPDWVVTIDPHPTRIVRWFGDPHFEDHIDEYWERQDLDYAFRANSLEENAKNIALVDRSPSKLIICTASSEAMVSRTAAMDRYFFTPLVDHPTHKSLTARLVAITKAPALNTGGTVGTAAYTFARCCLGAQDIAVVGMDFGYYAGTPLDQTQEFTMLKDEPDMHDFYPVVNGHWGAGFTSPTYEFYRRNFMDLLDGETVVNCSGGGFLQGDNVRCCEVEEWMTSVSGAR